MKDQVDRRTALVLVGSTGATALLAGCADDEGPAEPDDENGEPADDDGEAEWEDVEAFHFEGRIEAWTAVEPAFIEGQENPTITLIEGNEYDFSWVNADGAVHNMEIRDADDEIVEDYQSDDVGEEGEETSIEGVVASEEMTTYICTYHEATQVGDIEVQTG